MSRLSLIAAMDRNRLIGCENRLPWHLPADLQHFKRITMGKPILMGRKTWESLGRPLPGRLNIAISRNTDYEAEGAVVVSSLDEAVEAAGEAEEIMIIGGANLYQQALSRVNRLYLTRVDAAFEGDAWFPKINEDEWELSVVESHEPDDANAYPYRFETYDRCA
jgi:dihydrofolate reductase